MTPKERTAMQQALEFIDYFVFNGNNAAKAKSISTALREALDHFRDATKKVAEQAEQEPVRVNVNERANSLMNVSLPLPDYRHAYTAEQALQTLSDFHQMMEQEPVARHICNLWVDPATKKYVVDHCDHPIDELIPVYAAPVRTKDLTDDEIAQAVGSPLNEVYLADFRAVIAADREKNK